MEAGSHSNLLIAVAPMLGAGYLVAFVGLYWVWRERRKVERAQRKAAEAHSDSSPTQKPKAASA